MPLTIAEKRAAFRALHEAGCFMLPESVGHRQCPLSCRTLASRPSRRPVPVSRGPSATPTTHLPRDAILAHLRDIVGATDLPVNADFEERFSAPIQQASAKVSSWPSRTGVAGLSIEDSTGDTGAPLFPVEVAVERPARRAPCDRRDRRRHVADRPRREFFRGCAGP